jgi:hypothetical protein
MAIPALADGQFWPSPLPSICMTGGTHGREGSAAMPSFDVISITSVMVLECFVCDEWLGSCRVCKVWYECGVIKIPKSTDKLQEKIIKQVYALRL